MAEPLSTTGNRRVFLEELNGRQKVLLVDDDEIICLTLGKLLEQEGFEVTVAGNVSDALKLIRSKPYDVLLSDLHMPGAGDGLVLVSAMRQTNPKAVTMLLSSFPEMEAAAHAILLQADDILVKPMDKSALIGAITSRLSGGPTRSCALESVAAILERAAPECIEEWFEQVELESKRARVPLTREQRCVHLPQLFRDLVARLHSDQPLGTSRSLSAAAADHGVTRRKEGYSAAMLVEESRILEVSIFLTLQKNLASLDLSILLSQVMIIADEVDSQLRQAMESYDSAPSKDALPA